MNIIKSIVPAIGATCLISCGTSMKLAVPERFKQEATMEHVNGARGNKMATGHFTTSTIKRGIHSTTGGWGRDFFLENLLLNQIGIRKDETVTQEKARFRYALSDGENRAEIYADEKQITIGTDYQVVNSQSIFGTFGKLDQYTYIFSAIIGIHAKQDSGYWELVMTNFYDRKPQDGRAPSGLIKQGASGVATNGKDSIFIKPLSLQQTELSNGKMGQLPFKVLSGYELSTGDGVIAVVDMIDHNIWYYNELEPAERLNVSAIATAIFARRVKDEKW